MSSREHEPWFSDIARRLRRWADARDRRNPCGHGKTGTSLLREAAERIEYLEGVIVEHWAPSQADKILRAADSHSGAE